MRLFLLFIEAPLLTSLGTLGMPEIDLAGLLCAGQVPQPLYYLFSFKSSIHVSEFLNWGIIRIALSASSFPQVLQNFLDEIKIEYFNK